MPCYISSKDVKRYCRMMVILPCLLLFNPNDAFQTLKGTKQSSVLQVHVTVQTILQAAQSLTAQP